MASRKRKIGVQHISEILENGEDLLGECEEESDDNIESPAVSDAEDNEPNPYKYPADENPDLDDPYLYDSNKILQTKTAFYKSSGKNKKGTKKGNDVDDAASSGRHSKKQDDSNSEEGDESEEEDGIDSSDWEDLSDSDEEDSGQEDESSDDEEEQDSKSNGDASVSSRGKGSKTKQIKNKKENDEYVEDSSDEEEIQNTIGDTPVEWYDEYDHLGYDIGGERILKPDRGDSLDEFLKRMEDPDYKRKVIDKLTGQDVTIVDGDLELLHRVLKGVVPSAQYDLFERFEDLYSHEVMETPISGRPEHKRSFLPSKADRRLVSKFVHSIKMGSIHKHIRPKRYDFSQDLWNGEDYVRVPMRRRVHPEYRAPPARLPTNRNSFNPPPEFLPSNRELMALMHKAPKQRAFFESRLAKKYDSIREVPADQSFVMDVFNRCLDLYMCSRKAYRKPVGKAKDLLPDLPRPRDLRPFPSSECMMFNGHQSIVRVLSVHPNGHYLATGSDDQTIKIWNISDSRCIRTLEVGDAVKCLEWCPNSNVFLLAVAVGNYVLLINPESHLVDNAIVTRTNALFKSSPEQGDYQASVKVKKAVEWRLPSDEERAQGYRVVVKHSHPVTQMVWHQQGDFFATLQPTANTSAIITHQLSKWRSQVPFARAAVGATTISFHPKKPYFYICTQGRIRIYSLLKKKIHCTIKTPSSNWFVSSIAIHPSGEHFIVGSHAKRITWYEMENTATPFTLRYHHGAIRSLAFHKKYPLFASASDDGRVIITHSMVYRDWIKDPLIVPVKELKNHQFFDGLCVLSVAWHPHEAWLFTAGADGTVRMWQ